MPLPRINRLVQDGDFQLVIKTGRVRRGTFFFVKSIKNGRLHNRFGFVVPARIVKKATQRNTVRRGLAEVARFMCGPTNNGQDYVMVLVKASPAPDDLKRDAALLLKSL